MEMSSQADGHFLKVRHQREPPPFDPTAAAQNNEVTVTHILSSNNVPIQIVKDGHSKVITCEFVHPPQACFFCTLQYLAIGHIYACHFF